MRPANRFHKPDGYLCPPVNAPPVSLLADLTVDLLYDGAVLVIDKPPGWTSFDVVNKLKWIVLKKLPAPRVNGQKRKFRIGHAGTLDPLATGVLVVCTGKLTKSIPSFQSGLKTYTGIIRLGQTTPSYDLETTPEGNDPFDHLTDTELARTAAGFIGEQLQTPPVFSAKRIDGKRAYESARKGEEVIMRQATVTIHSFVLNRIELPDVHFEVTVTKGTYIRSLAHDFGQRLGVGSHLAALRRTASDPFSEVDLNSMDEITAAILGLSSQETA